MNAGRVSPSVALSAYAEAWINGAKVVVFGDASSALAERLVERGARHVQVYDVDATRAAEASAASSSKHIVHAALDLAGSSLRDGYFDFGIIEDLGAAPGGPKALLEPLERALSRRGLALIGSRNPDVTRSLIAQASDTREAPLGYYDFYDAVSRHFEEVRMLGQAAFVGYAIADFSASDASEVRLDTGLLSSGAEEPEWFLALASALPVSPDAFAVIQLPLTELDLGARGERADVEAGATRAGHAEAKLAALTAELEALRGESAQHAQRRDADKRQVQELEALKAELAKRDEWVATLESRATTADQRADEVQAELDRLSQAQRRGKEHVARLEQQLEEERRLRQKLEDGKRSLDDGKQRFDDVRRTLEERARALEAELDKRERRSESDARTQAELAKQAKQLGARVEELSAALAASEKKARELGVRVDELGASEKKARELGARVAELSAALATSEKKAREAADGASAETRAELLEVEALLKDRAAEVARLQAALHDTERFGRQLIVKLAELEAVRDVPRASPDVQALSQRNAELAADLEAARWTISSLEANVSDAPTATPEDVAASRRDELPPAEPRSAQRPD